MLRLCILWPVQYHWAVDEGRLDEVSLLFLWQKLFELIELC